MDGWTGVYGLRLENPTSPLNLPKALSFSLLQWLTLLKGCGGHSTPAHERLSFQSLFRQDWNKMSLVNHTASPHLLSHCASSPKDFPGAEHTAHTLPFQNWATSSPLHVVPSPSSLPQAPAAPVALTEAAVKHTSGLLSWPSPVL